MRQISRKFNYRIEYHTSRTLFKDILLGCTRMSPVRPIISHLFRFLRKLIYFNLRSKFYCFT
nr:hypothetical protein HmN_000734600 [Hymenolepis microstoma]